MSFFDLTGEQQEDILNTTTPDYEGTGEPPYGSITPNSTTDENGIATSIYTAGTEPGYIEFWVCDNDFKLSQRGSFIFILSWRKEHFGKEKLKLKVYLKTTNLPPVDVDKVNQAKNYIINSFSFLGSNRVEFVSQEFSSCNINEFNIDFSTETAGTPYEAGRYNSNANIKIYLFTIQQNYSDRYPERIGYTIAHEIGHSFGPNHLPAPVFDNHNGCIMSAYVTQLREGEQTFCDYFAPWRRCQHRIQSKLGE
ncbi:MAG TPA: hypothetical protein PKW86_05615 [bacterium]|nr:hypothetical protein [bacterium]